MKENNDYKKFLINGVAIFLLLLGIKMILVYWYEVVSLFRGAAGILFALAGLVTLYAVNNK